MPIAPERLADHLRDKLAPVYLLFGEEPLLIQESRDAVCEAARARGYDDRTVMTVEPGFDWTQLVTNAQSLSLFSSRRIIEVRMPGGKPGTSGGKVFVEYAQAPVEGVLLLVTAGRLDGPAQKSKWFKSLDAAGVSVVCRPVDERRLPAWIEQRMQRRGLRPDPGVVAVMAHYLVGNLLAVAQEIEKLSLTCRGGRVREEDVQASIADSARFNVFGLVDTCLSGDIKKARRMLAGLRAEGVGPVLVLWAMGREVRTMVRLAAALRSGRPQAEVFRAHRVWSSRMPVVTAALKRLSYGRWLRLLQGVGRLDRVLKGRLSGEIWLELERFSLMLCGVQTVSAE